MQFSKNRYLSLLLFLFLFGVFSESCVKDPEISNEFRPTPYSFNIPPTWPTILNIPADNPTTVEGVALGRFLFYDGRLSGRDEIDSLMSCATCHLQSQSFEIGPNHPYFPNGRPIGLTGVPTPHVMLPFINLVFNTKGYLWNGMINNQNTQLGIPSYGIPAEPKYHLKNLESLVWMGIVAKHEMAGSVEMTENMIRSIAMYPALFKAAFGTEEINIERISKAIAQFLRTLISTNSKFDRMLTGAVTFNDAERRGLVLFVTENGADCFHCHGGEGNILMTTNDFYNNAKDTLFNDPRDRYAVTKLARDHGAYKATTLRNIELTGPYMHDGRFKTLEQVIDFYSEGLVYSNYVHPLMHKAFPPYGTGIDLNPQQKADLKAFLLTLTDTSFLTNPAFSNPFNN